MNEVAWVKWCGCVVWGMGLGASQENDPKRSQTVQASRTLSSASSETTRKK